MAPAKRAAETRTDFIVLVVVLVVGGGGGDGWVSIK
jgi:hypothetical protein